MDAALAQRKRINKYVVKSELRNSAFHSPTYVSYHVTTEEKIDFVLKRLSSNIDRHIREHVDNLKSLSHNAIVRLKESFKDGESTCIVFEYNSTNLSEFLSKRDSIMSPKGCLKIVDQACAGIVYIHSLGLIHGNLKPSNIFLIKLSNGDMRVKLADMQPAASLTPGDSWKPSFKEPTSCYSAPETWSLNKNERSVYRSNCDVWALGCFAVHLLNRQPLFDINWSRREEQVTKYNELKTSRGGFVTLPRKVEEEFQNFASLIRQMLFCDPDLRPDSHEVMDTLVPLLRGHPVLSLNSQTGDEYYLASEPPLAHEIADSVEVLQTTGVILPNCVGEYRKMTAADWPQCVDRWNDIVQGKVGAVMLPPLQLPEGGAVLDVMLVRRDRRCPNANDCVTNSMVGSNEYQDVKGVAPLPSKDLRVLMKVREITDVEYDVNRLWTITLELTLPYVHANFPDQPSFGVTRRRSRVMTLQKEFQNYLLHFHPASLKLVSGNGPQVSVQVVPYVQEEEVTD